MRTTEKLYSCNVRSALLHNPLEEASGKLARFSSTFAPRASARSLRILTMCSRAPVEEILPDPRHMMLAARVSILSISANLRSVSKMYGILATIPNPAKSLTLYSLHPELSPTEDDHLRDIAKSRRYYYIGILTTYLSFPNLKTWTSVSARTMASIPTFSAFPRKTPIWS